MNNTQIIEANNFTVFRDGHIDKAWFYKTKAKAATKYAARQTLRAFVGTLNVLDELRVEFEKQYG